MPSAGPRHRDRKYTRRPGRKATTLRPESNTSGTAGGRVVTPYISIYYDNLIHLLFCVFKSKNALVFHDVVFVRNKCVWELNGLQDANGNNYHKLAV